MKLKYLKNVVKLKLNLEKCIGCGMCLDVCPHEVYSIENKKAVIIDKDACMECGACKKNCPVEAISVAEGVGCANAIFNSFFNGGKVACGCDSGDDKGSCC